MDRLESMTAFVAVAKSGGFSAAARQIGIPLATISRRVAELEAELGVRLLQRSTRHVALTEPGQSFFVSCQRILDELREATDAVTGEYRTPKGELTVTAPMGFGRLHLQPIAMDFLSAYPEINLRLLLVDRLVDLLEEHVDLALRIAELPDSRMIARPLGHVRMIVVASPAYLKRRGTPQHPEELLQHDCISWASLGPVNTWWFKLGSNEQTVAIRTRMVTTTAESAIAAAQSGLGLAQTTCYQAEQGLREGTLKIALQPFECGPTPVNLAYSTQRLLPLKMRAFIDFAAPRLTERLRSIGATIARAETVHTKGIPRRRIRT
jgi:DNA-binding transcriptional LysR family regulator